MPENAGKTPQVQIRIMGQDGEWWQPEQVPAILAALPAIREDIRSMAGTYTVENLRKIRAELRELDTVIARRLGEPEAVTKTAPMKRAELGRFVCVPTGSCLHAPDLTIRSDGVWVKGATMYSSAHRDCYEARQPDNG